MMLLTVFTWLMLSLMSEASEKFPRSSISLCFCEHDQYESHRGGIGNSSSRLNCEASFHFCLPNHGALAAISTDIRMKVIAEFRSLGLCD